MDRRPGFGLVGVGLDAALVGRKRGGRIALGLVDAPKIKRRLGQIGPLASQGLKSRHGGLRLLLLPKQPVLGCQKLGILGKHGERCGQLSLRARQIAFGKRPAKRAFGGKGQEPPIPARRRESQSGLVMKTSLGVHQTAVGLVETGQLDFQPSPRRPGGAGQIGHDLRAPASVGRLPSRFGRTWVEPQRFKGVLRTRAKALRRRWCGRKRWQLGAYPIDRVEQLDRLFKAEGVPRAGSWDGQIPRGFNAGSCLRSRLRRDRRSRLRWCLRLRRGRRFVSRGRRFVNRGRDLNRAKALAGRHQKMQAKQRVDQLKPNQLVQGLGREQLSQTGAGLPKLDERLRFGHQLKRDAPRVAGHLKHALHRLLEVAPDPILGHHAGYAIKNELRHADRKRRFAALIGRLGQKQQIAVAPAKKIEEPPLRLHIERVIQVAFGDRTGFHQKLAIRDTPLLAQIHRAIPLFGRDHPVRDHDLAEAFRDQIRADRHRLARHHVNQLFGRAPLQHEPPRALGEVKLSKHPGKG